MFVCADFRNDPYAYTDANMYENDNDYDRSMMG